MPNSTTRLGLLEPVGTDTVSELRLSITNNASTLDNALTGGEGTLANRPSASSVPYNYVYFASDVPAYYLSDGTTWRQMALGAGMWAPTIVTSSGSVAMATGAGHARVTLVGGGGGGGGGGFTTSALNGGGVAPGGAGGGGGQFSQVIVSLSGVGSLNATIGAGGAGGYAGTGTGGHGVAGGYTSLAVGGTTLWAQGGGGGDGGDSSYGYPSAGGEYGGTTSGSQNNHLPTSQSVYLPFYAQPGTGGSICPGSDTWQRWGGAGIGIGSAGGGPGGLHDDGNPNYSTSEPGLATIGSGGAGGNSIIGTTGNATNGADATGYGNGGGGGGGVASGGTNNAGAGGAGSAGIIIIEWLM